MALPTPRVKVTLAETQETVSVQTTHADAVRFDLVRSRLGWPAPRDASMLWTNFLAWHALRREVRAGSVSITATLPEKAEDSLDVFASIEFEDEDGNAVDADDAENIGVTPTDATA